MKFIPNAVTAKAAITLLKTQKHSPTIMFGVGVAGVVATAILASKATLKAQPVLDEHRFDIKMAEDHHERHPHVYTQKDLRKDKALLVVNTTVEVGKLYAPSILVGATSIGLLTGSHVVLNKRNASLTAAYASLDKAYREYRSRVRDEVGEQREKEVYRNVETVKTVEVDENGKKKQVTKKVIKQGKGAFSVYFSEVLSDDTMNPNWQHLPELNVLALRNLQNMFNNRLQANGYLFLGDILAEMHLPRTKESQQFGWVTEKYLRDKGDDHMLRDGYVDFGIFGDDTLSELTEFGFGNTDGIWLDFNVDGYILDLI